MRLYTLSIDFGSIHYFSNFQATNNQFSPGMNEVTNIYKVKLTVTSKADSTLKYSTTYNLKV